MGVVISLMSWAPLHVHISYSTTVFLPVMEELQWCEMQQAVVPSSWKQNISGPKPAAKHSTFLNVNGLKALISWNPFSIHLSRPQDNINLKRENYLKRENQNLSYQWFFLPLLFPTGIFVPIHGSSDPANTRQEFLCWKRKGLISPRNTCLPESTAISGLSWCLQITMHLAGGGPLLWAELPAKHGLWWLILWNNIVD